MYSIKGSRMIVVLMGYMASGKSVIGKKLSQMLRYNYMDLDQFIETKENATITQIFETKGEIYFRKKETEYLLHIIKTKDDLVLALGGGTPCYANNIETLLNTKNCATVYLKTPLNVLVDRLEKEKAKRPLIAHIKSREDLTEFVGKHLFERVSYYNQAELIIEVNDKSLDMVVETIILKLF